MKHFRFVASLKRTFSGEKTKNLPSKIFRLTLLSIVTGSLFLNLTYAAPKAPWSTTASTGCPTQGTGSNFAEVSGTVYMLNGGTSFYSFNPTTEACTALANFPVSISSNAPIVAIDSDTLYANNNGVTYRYDISDDRWIYMTRAVLDNGTPVDNSGATQNNGNSIVAFSSELYTIVGNGTAFQSYDPVTNTWTTRATTPASTNDGAAMTVVGSNIYAFRGANTTAFWQYNGTSWNAGIAQAPNTIEAGGALTAVGNTVYAFRGNNSKDFWSYDTVGDSWNTGLTNAPDYVSGGGTLVTIGTDIYAFQGNNARNFWKYDTVGGTWDDTLALFPQKILGVEGGGALTTDGTDIYATLGGNYNYYYKYTVGTDTWTRLNDIPLAMGGDATTAEGGLAYLNNVIYAVTGDGVTGTGTSALGLIWRYPLTGVNANTWPLEYKFPTPAGVTYGSAMLHPGTSAEDPTGDFFYMLRGQATSSFWKFTHAYQSFIPFTRSFHDATETELISQDGSGSTIAQGSGTTFVVVGGKIYMVIGGNSQVFVKYDPGTNQWERLMNAPDIISSTSAMTSHDNDTIWLVNSDDTFKYIISQDQWIAGAKMGTNDNGTIYSTQMAATQSTGNRIAPDGSGGLFMSAGSSTAFLHYNNDNNTWVSLTSIPASALSGFSIVRVGTKIYAIRGAATKTFYEYNIDTNSWSSLTNIPSTGNVEEGADIAYPGSGDYIYVLVGNLTQEFWRYSISGNSWTQLANTPSTVQGGGSLEILGNYAYAFRGINTTSFWRYDITQTPGADSWNTGLDPADAPAAVRAGGSLTTDGTNIYATRGAGTTNFWRYNIVGDTWTTTLEDVPEFVGTAGDTAAYGDLTYDPVSGDIYAVTGFGENDTPLIGETGPLYRYKLSAGAGQFTWPHVDAIPVNPSSTFRGAGMAYPGTGETLYLSTSSNFWTFNTNVEEWQAFPKAILSNGDPISQDGADHEGRSTSIYYHTPNGLFYVISGSGKNFQEYDPVNNEWSQLADTPIGLGVVETQMIADPNDTNKIYIFIDEGNTLLTDFWYSYDIPTDTWTTLETVPIGPGCANITYPGAGDWIYISACYSPAMRHSTWRYSISKELWVTYDRARFDGYVNGNPLTNPTPIAETDTDQGSGAALVDANNKIYMFTGGNTNFQEFDPSTNTWTTLAVAPATTGGGSALEWTGGEELYVIVNASQNFYSYCLPGSVGCTPDTWTLLTSSLPGIADDGGEPANWTSGADLYYPGTGDFIYSIVGRFSNDFFRFCFQNTGSGCTIGTWTKLAEAPASPGGFGGMASVDGNVIYALEGGITQGFWSYNIGTGVWTNLGNLAPATVNCGASLVEDGTYIYATRGNFTNDFWRYDPGGGGWSDAAVTDLPEEILMGDSTSGCHRGGITLIESTNEVWATSSHGRSSNSFNNYAVQGHLYRYKISTDEWPHYAAVKDNNLGQYRPTALASSGLDNYLYLLPGQSTTAFYRYTIEDKNGTPDRTAADPGPGTWTAMPPHPFATNGPLMTYANGFIYAMRGNSSTNFTRYDFTETNSATLVANEISSDNPATWALITDGTFTITIDGTPYIIDGSFGTGVNFSAVTSMADVATTVQTAIRAETGSTETVTYCDDMGTFNNTGYFIFRSATAPGGGGSISTLGRHSVFGTDISGVSVQGNPPVTLRGNTGQTRAEQTAGDWEYCGATGQPENIPVIIGDTSAGSRAGNMVYIPSLDEIWVTHSSGDSGNSDSDNTGLLWRYDVSANTWPYLPGVPDPPAAFDSGGDLTAYDNDTLYALRGANTNNFFEFDITGNSWINHSSTDPTPAAVVTGGSITSDGTTVYATRGNNTGDFWTYNPAAVAGSRWNDGGAPAQAPLAMGSTSTTDQKGQIRYNNNTIWAATGDGDNGIVDGTDALLNRYNTVADEWPGVTDPADTSSVITDFRAGTDLTSINGTDIYATRGDSTPGNNFFHYDIPTNIWTQLADMPAPNPAVAITDGGSIASVSTDTIYALRGNATNEFYRYDVSGNTWESAAIQDFPVNIGSTSESADRGDLLHVSSQNALYGIPGSGTIVYELDLNTRITVEQVNGGSSPEANTPFNITIQASDANGDPIVVGSNVDATITLETGTGNLGGTLTGTILSGNSQGTITGVTYDLPETGVSVRITDTSGIPTLIESVSDTFTVDPATPTIVSIVPNTGTTVGGTEVVITGTNFHTSTYVTFDGVLSPQVIFDSDTQITVITPPSNPAATTGAVDVAVSNPGPKTATEVGGFTYFGPTITLVNPNGGSTVGGQSTTITGTYFGPSTYLLDVDIDNTGAALTDYQVNFEFDTAALIAAGKMRSDCGDLRLYDSDQITPISYWVETGSCNTTTTRVWTKVDLAVGPSTKTIYAKYGNLSLTENQDGENIFDFFDDFEGSSVDTTKWTGDTAQFSVGNGILENTGNNSYRLSSINTFSGDLILEVKNISNTGPTNGFMPGGFFAATNNGIGYLFHSGTDYYRDDSSFISIGSDVLQDGIDMIFRFTAYGSNVDISAKNQSGTTTYHSATIPNTINNETISLGLRYDNGIYNQAYDADWDWVFVRQYAATPPTTTPGTETAAELTVTFGINDSSSVTRVSESELSVVVPASTTGAGPVDVIVTNGDGTTVTETNGYSYNLPPTFTNIIPNTGLTSEAAKNVTVNGTDFISGITLDLQKTGQSDISCSGYNYAGLPTSFTCNLDLTTAGETGPWDVVVTNPDTQFDTLVGGFTISLAPPTITNVNPDNGPEAGGTNVTITGTNFASSGYRTTVSITNGGGALSNHQVSFTLDTTTLISNTKMNADCSDLRVKDTDTTTDLPYYIESGCNTVSTIIWTKVPTIAATPTTTIIHVTYGTPALNDAQDGDSVFEFFDDFSGGSVSASKWPTTQGLEGNEVDGGVLTLENGEGLFGGNYAIPADTIWETSADTTNTSRVGGALRAAINTDAGFRGDGISNIVDILWWSGSLYAETNSGETFFGTFTTGFHNYKITYRPGDADTVNYDYDNGTATTSRSGSNAAGTLFPVIYNYSGTGSAVWDYIRIRKYASPSPSTALGSEIEEAPSITFDGTPVTNAVFVNSTTLTADTSAHAAGAVDVVVTNPDAQFDTLTNGFSYLGDPDVGTSTFTASAAAVVANGSTESILTATVKDSGNNNLEGEVVTVALTAGSGTPNIKAVNCSQADVGSVTKGTTNSNGQACFRVRSTDVTSPGNDTFTATITSIPAAITQTANVEFTLDYADQYSSTFGSAPGTVAADGVETSTLTATIVDTLGRVITGLTINATDNTGGNVVYDPIGQSEATNGSGIADFNVTNTTAETATFTASFNSQHYDKTSYTETASPTFVNDYEGTAATLIAGSQGNNVETTTTLPFNFELYGTKVTAGNNIYVCSNGYISLASTGCPSSGSLSNAIAGFFHDLDTTSGGIYREVASDSNSVRFLFDTEDVGSSNPVMFEIILTRSNRIELHYFVNSGLSARIGLYDGTASAAPDNASTFDNSVFGGTSASKFENSTISASVDLVQTTQVEFTAGAVVPGNSTVVANPTSVVANGTTSSTITVTLRDQFNNPVQGRTVELSDDQTAGQVNYVGEATPPPYPNDVTDTAGQVTFNVNSTTIDTVTFTATDITGGPVVIGTTQVEFSCILDANQQCVQINIEPSPGVLTITAPDDFAFPPATASSQNQDIFSVNSSTPYTLNTNDVVIVTDTQMNGGFNLQLQSSVFEDATTLEQIPLTGLYTVTQASSTGGSQNSGVEYDLGYAGVTNITAPQNNATAGSLSAASTFTTNGDNLDSIIDLMVGPVTIAEQGRDGQFKQNVQYYLLIPAFTTNGDYQVTLTFDLTRTAQI